MLNISPSSKAQQKATNKYIAKAYDRIEILVKKGEKEKIKAHAQSKGESLNSFVNRAIDETIERDKGDGEPNAVTLAAMQEADGIAKSGQGFDDVEDMLRELKS